MSRWRETQGTVHTESLPVFKFKLCIVKPSLKRTAGSFLADISVSISGCEAVDSNVTSNSNAEAFLALCFICMVKRVQRFLLIRVQSLRHTVVC